MTKRMKRQDMALTAASPLTKLRRLPFKLIPRDTQRGDTSEDTTSLIHKMERSGMAKFTNPMLMLKARGLYCRKMLDRATVAKQCGLNVSLVDRWIVLYGWEDERRQTEIKWYERVSTLRRTKLDCDVRHDRMFQDLETLIEDTIARGRNETDPNKMLEIKDIQMLAAASKTCMESRRKIHKKDAAEKITTQVLAIQGEGVFGNFANMMANILAPNGGERIKAIDHSPASPEVQALDNPDSVDHASGEDVEFE